MNRTSQEFFYSLVLSVVFIGVASAGPKMGLSVAPIKQSNACPSEKAPKLWRWGQTLPGGPQFKNMDLAKIRLNCKEFELPEGTLIYDHSNIYVLKRGKETTNWWDLKTGKSYRGVMILKNAADSGELIQLLWPAKPKNSHLLNQRTSNFQEEKNYPAGDVQRKSINTKITLVLKSREHDLKFQDFVKSYVEANKVKIPIPFKATPELLEAELEEVIRLINTYYLQRKG